MKPYSVFGHWIEENQPFLVPVMALNPRQACLVAAYVLHPDGVPEECTVFDDICILDVIEGHHESVLKVWNSTKDIDIPAKDAPQYIGICPSLDEYLEQIIKEN